MNAGAIIDVSDDGEWVAVRNSTALSVVEVDTGDVTEVIAHATHGLSLSADGAFLSFVDEEPFQPLRVRVWDRVNDTFATVDDVAANQNMVAGVRYTDISADGDYVVFTSGAYDSMFGDDTGSVNGVYRYDRIADDPPLLVNGGTADPDYPDAMAYAPHVSNDGDVVWLQANGPNGNQLQWYDAAALSNPRSEVRSPHPTLMDNEGWISADGTSVITLDPGTDHVVEIDLATGTGTDTGGRIDAIADVSEDGQRVVGFEFDGGGDGPSVLTYNTQTHVPAFAYRGDETVWPGGIDGTGTLVAAFTTGQLSTADTDSASDAYLITVTPDVDFRPSFGGHVSSHSQAGDPVDAATGNFSTTEVDLQPPDGSWAMAWTRSYNAMDPLVGPLGVGWSTAFSHRVVEVDADLVEVVQDDGRVLQFVSDGIGGWDRPPAFNGELSEVNGLWQVAFLDGSRWNFDAAGLLSTMTNWDGQTVTVARDTSSRLATVTSSTGYDLTVAYDGDLLETVTDSDGRVVTYAYDSVSDALESITTPAGVTTLEHDTAGRVTEIVDPGPVSRLQNVYDALGRVQTQTMPSGEVITFTYNGDGTTTVHESVSDSSVLYHHDASNRWEGTTDPFEETTGRTYDAQDNLLTSTARTGGVLTQTYDAAGRVLTSTAPGAGTTTYTYDSQGRVATMTVPNGTTSGMTTTFTYDGNERLPSVVTDDLDNDTTYVIEDGLVMSVTDPDGVATTFDYDTRRRLIETTDDVGNVTTTDYCEDSTGLTVHVTAPRGAATTDASACTSPDPDDFVTETRYDLAGRILWERAPDGGLTSYDYDTAGRLESVTDPAGAVTSYTYDTVTGELATETRPAPTGSGATTVTTTYDTEHRTVGGQPRDVRVTIAPDGARTEQVYGPLRRLEQTIVQTAGASTTTTADDEYRTTTYTYAVDGQVATTTDGEGGITTNRYDTAGRLVETCDGEGRRTVNVYDTDGRLTAVRGPWDENLTSTACATGALPTAAPHVTYEYDDLNRRTAEVNAMGDRTETDYTPGGRVDTQTDGEGLVTTHGYDAAGRLAFIDLPGNAAQRRTTFGYDADGNTTTVTDGEGNVTTTTYDPMGRTLTTTTPAGVTTTETWSDRGELLTRQLEGQGTEEFHYDASGAMDWVEDAINHRTDYEYDLVGRPTTRVNAVDDDYQWTWSDDGQVLSETDELNRTTAYTYDDAGRVATVTDPTARAATTSYNAAGQPVSVAYLGGDTVTYAYDAAGRRASATTAEGTWSWTYHADGSVASQTDPAGRVTGWTYGDNGRREQLLYPDGSTVLYGYETTTGRLDTLRPGETMADSFTGPDGDVPEGRKWNTQLSGGGTATLDGNRLELAYPNASGAASGVISDAPDATNIDVSFRYQFADTTNLGQLSVNLRETTGTGGSSYYVEIRNTNATARIYRTAGSVATLIGTFTVPVTTDARRLHVQLDGNQIRVRHWADGTAEPTTWSTTVTDSNVTGPGRARVRWLKASQTASSVTIDDWSQTDRSDTPATLVDYGYDDADNVTSETLLSGARSWTWQNAELSSYNQTVPGASRSTSLTYDSSGRLATSTTGTLTQTYGYDNAGQLTSVTPSIGTATTYTYDDLGRRATQRLGTANPTTYGYDDASQLTSITPPTGSASALTYDAAGRRLDVTTGSTVTTYTYDEAGRLETTTTPTGTATTQTRTYDPDGRLNTLANTASGTTTSYTMAWDGTELIGWSRPPVSGDVKFVGPQARRVARTGGPENENATTAIDILGSILPSTGDAFSARAADYDTWGLPAGFDTVQPRLGYRGELHIWSTIHLRAREYDPGNGVFTSTDPLDGVNGAAVLANPYHYANNAPLNQIDPLGLRPGDDDFEFEDDEIDLGRGFVGAPPSAPPFAPGLRVLTRGGLILGAYVETGILLYEYSQTDVPSPGEMFLPFVGESSNPASLRTLTRVEEFEPCSNVDVGVAVFGNTLAGGVGGLVNYARDVGRVTSSQATVASGLWCIDGMFGGGVSRNGLSQPVGFIPAHSPSWPYASTGQFSNRYHAELNILAHIDEYYASASSTGAVHIFVDRAPCDHATPDIEGCVSSFARWAQDHRGIYLEIVWPTGFMSFNDGAL